MTRTITITCTETTYAEAFRVIRQIQLQPIPITGATERQTIGRFFVTTTSTSVLIEQVGDA